MTLVSSIIIIEDDLDDRELLSRVCQDLQIVHEVKFFENAPSALSYLRQPNVRPFVIISDINMPGMNGFEMRDRILAEPLLADRCTPFIFCSTVSDEQSVRLAYLQHVQGIFRKPDLYAEWKAIIQAILQYWSLGMSPNRLKVFA